MTPGLMDRLARLEHRQRVAGGASEPMPPTLCELALRTAAEAFGGYPRGGADTLADGLARALGYASQAEADAGAETDRETFAERMGALWPRLAERYTGSPQAVPEETGDETAFRAWCGILDGPRHYRSDEAPTADLRHLPNGLPLFDYDAASVRAALMFFGVVIEDAEARRDVLPRH